MTAMRPTLASIVQAAVDATGAERGWLVAIDQEEAVVAAAVGDAGSIGRVGERVVLSAAASLALQGGHAAAISPGPTDTTNSGAGGHEGTPSSILAVPCGDEEAIGVIEVVSKTGGQRFSFDDVELCTLLANIAGSALAEDPDLRSVPSAAELGSELRRLEAADSDRYAHVAELVGALLGLG